MPAKKTAAPKGVVSKDVVVDDTNVSKDQVTAGMTARMPRLDSDVGVEELISMLGLLNAKRTVEEYQDMGLHSGRVVNAFVDTHVGVVTSVASQIVSNAATQAHMITTNAIEAGKALNTQSLAHRDTSYDKIVNVNETDALALSMVQSFAKNPVQMDALVDLLIAAVAERQK